MSRFERKQSNLEFSSKVAVRLSSCRVCTKNKKKPDFFSSKMLNKKKIFNKKLSVDEHWTLSVILSHESSSQHLSVINHIRILFVCTQIRYDARAVRDKKNKVCSPFDGTLHSLLQMSRVSDYNDVKRKCSFLLMRQTLSKQKSQQKKTWKFCIIPLEFLVRVPVYVEWHPTSSPFPLQRPYEERKKNSADTFRSIETMFHNIYIIHIKVLQNCSYIA